MTEAIERRITIYRDDWGQRPLSATVSDDPNGHAPVLLHTPDNVVHLRWSEWDEVRDHIEYCAGVMRPEPTQETSDDTVAVPADEAYPMCGDRTHDVDSPCVLETGHLIVHHCDRLGARW